MTRSRVESSGVARPLALGALLSCAALLLPVEGAAFYGDRLEAFGVDGSIRTTSLMTRNYDAPLLFGKDNSNDGMAQTTLRLVAGGKPLDWLKFEVHAVQLMSMSALSGPMGGSGGGVIGGTASAPAWRLHALSLDLAEDPGDVSGQLVLDRCELRLASDLADVIIGRQAISFGKAWFWNPLDVFAAFGPMQLDRDYKPGVDALRVEVPIGESSGFTLVAAMGDVQADKKWRQLGVIGRAFTTLKGFDVALQGGLLRGGYQVGGAFSGEIEPVDVRAEVAWNQPREESGGPGGHLVAIMGISRRFESELSLSFEQLLHTGGPDDLAGRMALTGTRQLMQASRQASGVMASYPLIPVLTGSIAALMAWDDSSVTIQPGLGWSAADEVDVSIGGLLAFGKRPTTTAMSIMGATVDVPELQSEFGTWPHMLYAQLKAYF